MAADDPVVAASGPRNEILSIPLKYMSNAHPNATLADQSATGPLSFFNPTRATFDLKPADTMTSTAGRAGGFDGPALPEGAQIAWRARDNRKGRHVLVLPRHGTIGEPPVTSSWAGVRKGIWRMCVVWAWWDVSWWIAVLFSVGSAIFVASGFFYWLPLVDKSTGFNGDGIAGGVTAFVGATLFTIGGVLLIVEASNENQTGCFGWALEQAFTPHHHDQDQTQAQPSPSDSEADNGSPNNKKPPSEPTAGITRATPLICTTTCSHHHGLGVHRRSSLHLQHPEAGRRWEWCPSWHELTTHYFHEMGFVGSFILAIGAVIFYISGIMALPWIYNGISAPVLYGTYWLAYLVGGIFFVASSALYMLETQHKWYLPAPRVLGWWIGTFNMIGSVGWVLSAAFGYCTPSWCSYQSDLSLLWASAAFLIGSLLLWYEALDKYPVVRAHK